MSGGKGQSKSLSVWLDSREPAKGKTTGNQGSEILLLKKLWFFYCTRSLILVSWLEHNDWAVQFLAPTWTYGTPDEKLVDMRIWGGSDVSACKGQNNETRGTAFPATEEKVTGEHLVLWRGAYRLNPRSHIIQKVELKMILPSIEQQIILNFFILCVELCNNSVLADLSKRTWISERV